MRGVHDRLNTAKAELDRVNYGVGITVDIQGEAAVSGLTHVYRGYLSGKVAVLGFVDQYLSPSPKMPVVGTTPAERQAAYEDYVRFQYDDGLTPPQE